MQRSFTTKSDEWTAMHVICLGHTRNRKGSEDGSWSSMASNAIDETTKEPIRHLVLRGTKVEQSDELSISIRSR